MRIRSELIALGLCCFLAGCGGGNSGTAGPRITSVTVAPGSANVVTGATQQFGATVDGTGSFSSQVTWSVNGVVGGNSTYGTVTSEGLYTAPAIPPSPSAIAVEAISSEDASKTGAASANVLNPAPTLSAISPSSANEGAGPLLITINGLGFNPMSSAVVGGGTRATTFVDSTHLRVQLSASDLVNPMSLPILISNPSPGGGTSSPLAFAVLSTQVAGGIAGPSFTAARDATIGGEGCCVTIADFNEDGIPDVATVHFTYDISNPTPRDQMYIQFGDGHGNFRSREVLQTGSGPKGLMAGDFNHDGHVDLVTINSPIEGVTAPPSISIFLGDGKGNFTRSDETLSNPPDSITIGDFNNDGKLDLAVGMVPPGVGSTTLILLGKGDGTFQPGATLPAPGGDSAAAADFNEDGNVDLFTCNILQKQCYLYLGNGDGTFAPAQIVTSNIGLAGPFIAADMDGDGHLDLVLQPSVPGPTTYVLWGDGTGNFSMQTIPAGSSPDIAVGDIDGDGRKDIVVDGTGVLYQRALRTFTLDSSARDFGVSPAVADLNNDGFVDVIGYRQANVRSYLSSGTQGLVHSQITYFTDVKAIALGDFNGDGKLDVAATDASSVTIMSGDGTGTFSLGTPFGNLDGKIWGIVAGDFTGDGIPDLAVGADDIVIYQGDGKGNFTEFSRVPQVTLGDSGAIGTLLATDVNGDGKLDLVAAAAVTPDITVLIGDGAGHFTIGSQIALTGASIGVAAGDFNGDGLADLAITDYQSASGLIRPFFGDGTGKFTAGTPTSAGSEPYSVAAADFDKDGNLDLVIADFTGGTLYTMPVNSVVLFGDGHGNFPRSLVLSTGSRPSFVAVADIDNDGWPDIVVINSGSSDFDVFINDRNGSFLPPYTFSTGVDPAAFAIGDVDGDGQPDVVSVIQNGIEVTLNRTSK